MPATPALKHKAADVADGQLGRTVQRHGHMAPRDQPGSPPCQGQITSRMRSPSQNGRNI